MSNKDVP